MQVYIRLLQIFKTIFKLYKFVAISIGTFLMVMWSILLIEYFFEDEFNLFTVPLNSGFLYIDDMKDGSKDGHNLSDKNGRIIIYSDVKRFVESGNTIYGYREDLNGNPFYFICDYGQDCIDSQNLTDAQLRKIIDDRHLPLYTSSSGTDRYDLKRQLQIFYEKNDKDQKPKWEYDEKWQRYTAN